MKNKLLLFLICFFSGTPLFAYAKTINFKDSVHLALSQSPIIKESKAYIVSSNAMILQQRALALPSLRLDINAQRSDNALNVFSYKLSQRQASFADFGADQYTGPASVNIKPNNLNHPGYYSNVNTGFVLNIPLFSGWQSIENIRAARHIAESRYQSFANAKQTLIYHVLEAYDGYLTSRRILQDAKIANSEAVKCIQLTNALRKQSVVIGADVLLAQANARAKKLALNTAILENIIALKTFRVVIGAKSQKLTPQNMVYITKKTEKTNALMQEAFTSNPQIQSLELLSQANKNYISAARGEYLPKVNLQLRHDWNDRNFSLSNPSNTAILSFNWALLNFGIQSSNKKNATAQYTASQAAISNEQNNLRILIYQLKENIYTAQNNLNLANKNIPALKQVISEYTDRFGRGLLTLGQVLNVQNQLDNARIQRDLARYQLTLANARLLTLLNQLKA